MVILASASAVKAVGESSFTFTATPDKTELKPGDSVSISLKVGDINLGTNGMNTLEGVVKFDNTIFEVITEDTVSGQNNWSASINPETDSANYGKFFFNKTSNGIKTETVIGTITLKVKANIAEDTPTVVTISNIASNDGENLVPVANKVINFNIKAKPEEPAPGTNTVTPEVNTVPEMNITTNEQTPGMNVATNKTPGGTVNKTDNTTKNDKLPQTGENIVIGTSIIAVGALAIYFYIRAYKMQ